MGPLVSSHCLLNAILLSNAAAAVQVHEFGHRVGMAHATVYRLDASTDAKVSTVAVAASRVAPATVRVSDSMLASCQTQ
jgi:hypothetical protein